MIDIATEITHFFFTFFWCRQEKITENPLMVLVKSLTRDYHHPVQHFEEKLITRPQDKLNSELQLTHLEAFAVTV